MDNPYRAPQGEIITPTGGTNPASWKEILFSFRGRIPRRQFWASILFQFLLAVGFVIVVFLVGGGFDDEGNPQGIGTLFGLIFIIPFYIVSIWIGLAVSVKRWHDRDKSGWWMLIALIPLIGAVWAFIENGCLRGTVGPNRFGDDPT